MAEDVTSLMMMKEDEGHKLNIWCNPTLTTVRKCKTQMGQKHLFQDKILLAAEEAKVGFYGLKWLTIWFL